MSKYLAAYIITMLTGIILADTIWENTDAKSSDNMVDANNQARERSRHMASVDVGICGREVARISDGGNPQDSPQPRIDSQGTQVRNRYQDSEALYRAIVEVESEGDPNAYDPNEDAAGILQARPIMVRDANRILGYPVFTLQDRWNVEASEEMFWTVTGHYIRAYGLPDTFENRARLWNGGGKNGHKKKSTLAYWRKVSKELHQ